MQHEKGRRGARPGWDSPFLPFSCCLVTRSRFEQRAWSNRVFGGLAVPLTIFCIATYRKGDEFLRECRRQGCRVLLLTEEKLRDSDWPREAVDEFYYLRRDMPAEDIRKGIANVGRTQQIDRIVALDDFDVELAAMLREYIRVPGMGETTAHAFRDKLAMRGRARGAGIRCPDFVHVLNNDSIREWTSRIPPPWVMKPRSQAAAVGIKKLHGADELWSAIDDARRRACRLPARTVRARRRVPRRLDCVRPRAGVRDGQPLRDAADGGGARGRHLRHAHAARRRRRGRAAAGDEQAGPDDVRAAAGRFPHRVHPRRRRRAVFSRDLGARRRRLHRRRHRSGLGRQPVAGMGEGGDCGRARHLRAAGAPEPARRHRPLAGPPGVSGYERLHRTGDRAADPQEAPRRADRGVAESRAGRRSCSRSTSGGSTRISTPRHRRQTSRWSRAPSRSHVRRCHVPTCSATCHCRW